MELPLPWLNALLADKGCASDRSRKNLLMHAILPIIPPKANRKVPEHPGYRRYRGRNRVELMFNKLKQSRRIATRYDKTAFAFQSVLNRASVRLSIKSYANTA